MDDFRLKALAAIVPLLMLGGCGSDGGGGGIVAPPPASATISGVAAKGILKGARVQACVDADCSEQLGETTSGTSGSFNINVPSNSGVVVLKVSNPAGGGATMVCDALECQDEAGTTVAFGESLPMPTNLELRSVAEVSDTASAVETHVSPLTEILVRAALISEPGTGGTLSAAAVDSGKKAVRELFGLSADVDVTRVQPIDLTDEEAVKAANGEANSTAREVALLSAAFASKALADLADGSIEGLLVGAVSQLDPSADQEQKNQWKAVADNIVTTQDSITDQVSQATGESFDVDPPDVNDGGGAGDNTDTGGDPDGGDAGGDADAGSDTGGDPNAGDGSGSVPDVGGDTGGDPNSGDDPVVVDPADPSAEVKNDAQVVREFVADVRTLTDDVLEPLVDTSEGQTGLLSTLRRLDDVLVEDRALVPLQALTHFTEVLATYIGDQYEDWIDADSICPESGPCRPSLDGTHSLTSYHQAAFPNSSFSFAGDLSVSGDTWTFSDLSVFDQDGTVMHETLLTGTIRFLPALETDTFDMTIPSLTAEVSNPTTGVQTDVELGGSDPAVLILRSNRPITRLDLEGEAQEVSFEYLSGELSAPARLRYYDGEKHLDVSGTLEIDLARAEFEAGDGELFPDVIRVVDGQVTDIMTAETVEATVRVGLAAANGNWTREYVDDTADAVLDDLTVNDEVADFLRSLRIEATGRLSDDLPAVDLSLDLVRNDGTPETGSFALAATWTLPGESSSRTWRLEGEFDDRLDGEDKISEVTASDNEGTVLVLRLNDERDVGYLTKNGTRHAEVTRTGDIYYVTYLYGLDGKPAREEDEGFDIESLF